MMDKRELISKIARTDEEQMMLAHIYDLWEKAERRNCLISSDFLSPQEVCLTKQLLQNLAGSISYTFFGGFEDAERQALFFIPDYLNEPDENAIQALRLSWYEGDTLTHRDLLGSLVGLGIERKCIGDILVSSEEHCADILVMENITPYLLEEYHQAGRVRIRTEQVSLSCLHFPQKTVKEIKDTVASMRLDSVLSAAFSISRGKACEAIQSGKVQVNWKEEQKTDSIVRERDVLTCRGLGKAEIVSCGNPTKKGRLPLCIHRYI